MTGIIFAIIAIICFTIVFIDSVANSNISGAISTLLLIFLNVYLLKLNIDKYIESQETRTTIIKDIKEFSSVREYLKKQKRFKHLNDEDIKIIEDIRNKKWKDLRDKVGSV